MDKALAAGAARTRGSDLPSADSKERGESEIGPERTRLDSVFEATLGTLAAERPSTPHTEASQPQQTMNAQEALDLFAKKVSSGDVVNLRTGETGSISRTVQAAVESCVRAAFMQAAGTSDLDAISYTAYADRLDEYALAHAAEHGLEDGTNRASRCRRFVATVEGRVRKKRRSGRSAVPGSWRPLYDVLRKHEISQGRRPRKAGFLTALAHEVGVHGIRCPRELPAKDVLHRRLVETGQVKPQAFSGMLSAYRMGRDLCLTAGTGADLPDVDRCPATNERGLRSLPDIVERLEAAGYTGSVADLEVVDAIRLLAPRWHSTMSGYLQEYKGNRALEFQKKVIGASSRYLAALVRSGHGDLATAHPTPLLLTTVRSEHAVTPEAVGGEEWEEEFAESLGVSLPGVDQSVEQLEVRLLEVLAHEMANESVENSHLTALKGTTATGPAFWTESLISDTRLVGSLATFAAQNTRLLRARPELELEMETAVQVFLRRMNRTNSRVSFADRKPKARLLELVTLPLVLYMGLPALRKRVLELRRKWEATVLRHRENPGHDKIMAAEELHDRWQTGYLILAAFLADGLRLANYTHARLGPLGRDRLITSPAPDGSTVRSYCHILPRLDVAGRVIGVDTNFYGDDNPCVKLKIDKVPGSDEWREHPHWLRPGIVDMKLMHDHLTRVRPKRLAQQGLIGSVEEYDLERDIAEQHFALFVSDTASDDPYRSVTGCYVPGTVSQTFGRMLHWVCTEALGRDLPTFGPDLRERYPRVFSAHSSRLLLGTHLFGILRRPTEAAVLLNDTTRMVERRYSVTEASMLHKTGWEHPRYFDDLFERVWDQREAVDWDSEDPLQGLPGPILD